MTNVTEFPPRKGDAAHEALLKMERPLIQIHGAACALEKMLEGIEAGPWTEDGLAFLAASINRLGDELVELWEQAVGRDPDEPTEDEDDPTDAA